jgi:hypothetical protein
MKRILLITLVFLAWTGSMFSQNIPFPTGGAIWKEEHITIAGPFSHYFTLCGDSLEEDIIYQKVFELQVNPTGQVVGEFFHGLLHAIGSVITFRFVEDDSDRILYDFGLEAGDEITLNDFTGTFTFDRMVDSVKTENLLGASRKVIYFHPGYAGAPVERWIEGIGSTYGLLGRAFDPGFDVGFALQCFKLDDQILQLTNDNCVMPAPPVCLTNTSDESGSPVWAVQIQPNPNDGQFSLRLKENTFPEASVVKVYRPDGRLVAQITPPPSEPALFNLPELPGGVYTVAFVSQQSGRLLGAGRFVCLK